jgi:hypothetical protein
MEANLHKKKMNIVLLNVDGLSSIFLLAFLLNLFKFERISIYCGPTHFKHFTK